jgi:hypothetical protein
VIQVPCRTSSTRGRYSPSRVSCFLLFLMLSACGSQGDSEQEGPSAPPPGLLQNPDFALREDGRTIARPWSFSQHSGERSYDYRVDEGVLSIQRIGSEPWALMAQRLPNDTMEGLVGKTLEFSVDVTADLTDAYGDPMTPTGPQVNVWTHSGDPNPHRRAMAGVTLAITARSPVGLGPGSHPWQRHVIRFQVPENVSRIEVSLNMTMGGELRARQPSLIIVD